MGMEKRGIYSEEREEGKEEMFRQEEIRREGRRRERR